MADVLSRLENVRHAREASAEELSKMLNRSNFFFISVEAEMSTLGHCRVVEAFCLSDSLHNPEYWDHWENQQQHNAVERGQYALGPDVNMSKESHQTWQLFCVKRQ